MHICDELSMKHQAMFFSPASHYILFSNVEKPGKKSSPYTSEESKCQVTEKKGGSKKLMAGGLAWFGKHERATSLKTVHS